MSTKIYNGFKFNTTDFLEIHNLIAPVRQVMQKIKLEKTAATKLAMAVSILDRRALGLTHDDMTISPASLAWMKFDDRVYQIKKTGERDPGVDFDFNVVLIPHNGTMLGLYYSEQRVFSDLWKSQPFVSDYYFQNSSDPDPDVPEDEWAQRGIDWDAALGDDAPAERGWSIQLLSSDPEYMTLEEAFVLSAPPSVEHRIDHVAKEVAYDKWCEMQKINKNKAIHPSDNELKPQSPRSQYIYWCNWIRDNDEGEAFYTEVRASVAGCLEMTVTADVLRAGPATGLSPADRPAG